MSSTRPPAGRPEAHPRPGRKAGSVGRKSGEGNPRKAAAAILSRLDKAPTDLAVALDQAFAVGVWDPRDRRLAAELVYGVARWRYRLDRIITHTTKKRIKDVERSVRTLLRLGIYQLLYLDRVPDRAAVDETVRLAGKNKKKRGFVNGVLRAVSRGSAIPEADDPVAKLAFEYALPKWLAKRWLDRLDADEATARARHGATPAPLTLRVEGARIGANDFSASLSASGLTVTRSALLPNAVRISGDVRIAALPGYAEGFFYVQDEASQWVGQLACAQAGERVLDACAAPGGKATLLAAAVGSGGEVVALEVDAARANKIVENAARLGAKNLRVVVTDAGEVTPDGLQAGAGPGAGGPESRQPESRQPESRQPESRLFDRVLLDAPCSGLGVLGRHPEGKWWKTEAGISHAAVTQKKLLESLSAMVRPGGSLIYAVCTGEAEETHQVVEPFLAAHPEFTVVPATRILGEAAAPWTGEAGYLDTNGNADGMDGFFAVHMTRQS